MVIPAIGFPTLSPCLSEPVAFIGAASAAPYYRIFNVAIANATHSIVTIQNLVTILLS